MNRWGGSVALLVVGSIALVAGSLLALAARGTGPWPGDLALTRSLQQLEPRGLVGSLLVLAGEAALFLPPLLVLSSLLMRRWLDALFLFLASLTGVFVGDVLLKALVGRPRPVSELVRVSGTPEGYSFPSGTVFLTTVVLGAACYLIWREQPRRIVVAGAIGVSLLVVSLVGLSRVYSGEHWPTDVLGGWLLGGAWAIVLAIIYRRWLSRRAGNPEETTRRRKPGRR